MFGLHFRSLVLAAMCISVASGSASAQHEMMHAANDFDRDGALDISQEAIGSPVGDHQFTDSKGNIVRLSDFNGRAVAVNMIYTSCSHTCPMLVHGLKRAVEVADKAVGEENLVVLTVGFDVRNDTVSRMQYYKKSRGVDRDDWLFLSASQATIDALAKDIGFEYGHAPQGFDHIAQITLLDRDRHVFAQVYGQNVPTPNFVEPLKRLVFGRAASLSSLSGVVNQVRLFCTIYNPNTGRYQFDYSLILSLVIGLAYVSLVGAYLIREFRSREA